MSECPYRAILFSETIELLPRKANIQSYPPLIFILLFLLCGISPFCIPYEEINWEKMKKKYFPIFYDI